MDKLKNIEFYEYPFYLKCKNCHNPPEIILNDNENIIISCNKCSLYDNEKIENLCNYSSDWITNDIKIPCSKKHTYNDFASNQNILNQINLKYIIDLFNSFFIKKEKNEYIKIPSCKYCKICNIFLCEVCLRNHQKKKSHELFELYDLKPNYCYKHNQKVLYYCHKCDKNICKDCLKGHNKHFYERIEIINEKKDKTSIVNFIENSEDVKHNKYASLYKNIIWLQNFHKNEKESKKYLNNILSKILDIFYKDLKTAINLQNFAKIIFATCKIFNEENEINYQYNTILDIVKKYFSLEKIKD